MNDNLTIVILAAGLGTRMRSKKAKVLHRAGGLTLVEHAVNTALELTTPERVIVVVGHQADQVRAALAGKGVKFVLQTEQKGTGHALAVCRDAAPPDGYLALMYGDGPLLTARTLRRLVEAERESGAGATLITTVLPDPTGYGRIIFDAERNVAAIVEEKPATPEQRKLKEVNPGIYCFDAGLLWRHIEEIQPNFASGEYYLTDMPEILHRAGHRVRPIFVEDWTELMGINTRAELAQVDRILRDRVTTRLMLEGVTIVKPETVTIDASVKIGRDTIVEPFAQILGRTVIGEDCRIGACSVIADSELGDGVEILQFTIVGTSKVGSGSHVGPYARLRMANTVAPNGHIGNFVELKKTEFGSGSKAMHLAYLGDSVIGENVNVGAGTITCNYDGVAKHQTRIGSGAFVGSNSTLVAPVEVGASSYVGAGSVVTDPVPEGALALGRGRQVVKAGWVEKRRAKKAK